MKVVFSKSNKIGSLLIRLVTWSKYSHVGILSDDESTVIEALAIKGVVETPLREFLERNSRVELAELPGDYEDAKKYLGRPYDYTALLGIFLHRDWGGDKNWFCSELVAKVSGAFRRYGVGRITPEHCRLISKHIRRLKG